MSTALVPLPAGAHGVEDPEQAAVLLRYLAHGENLLDDGQFNDGITAWTASADATIDHDAAADFVGGAGSLHAERTAATGNELARSDAFTAHPHVAYGIAAWLRGTNARLRLAWFDEDDNEVTAIFDDWLVVTPEADDASEFRRVHAWGLAPAEAAAARVILEETNQTIGNEAWLDGITTQVLIPVAVEPYTVPTIQSGQTGGDLTFAPSLGGQHLGDVQVFDMEDGDDMTLASSQYTRIRGLRHRFRGDVLVQGSGLRLRVGRGMGAPAAIQVAYYDDGAWSDPIAVHLATADYDVGDYEVEEFALAESSPGRARIVTRDSLGSRATITVRRGEPFIHVATARPAESGLSWDAEGRIMAVEFTGTGPRLSVQEGSQVFLDGAMEPTTDLTDSSGHSLTEPHFYAIGPDHGAVIGLGFAFFPQHVKDTGTTDANRRIQWIERAHDWRDGASLDEEPGRVRHHFIILCPWPWAKQRHFVEAEDDPDSVNVGATVTAGGDASEGSYVALDAEGDRAGFAAKRGRDLPPGRYALAVRARYASTETEGSTRLVVEADDGSDEVAEGVETLDADWALYELDFNLRNTDPEALRLYAETVPGGETVSHEENLTTGHNFLNHTDDAWAQGFRGQSQPLEGVDIAMEIDGSPDVDLNVGIYPMSFDVAPLASRSAVVITGSAGWTDSGNITASSRDWDNFAKWGTGSGTSRGAVEWDFGSGNTIHLKGFAWKAKTNGHGTFHMALQYSDDGSTWTTVLNDTSVGTSTSQTRRMWTDGTEGAHRYWRGRITTTDSGESWVYELVPLALTTDVGWTTYSPGSTVYREPCTFAGDFNEDRLIEGSLTIPAASWASSGFSGTQHDFTSPLALNDGERYAMVLSVEGLTTGGYNPQLDQDVSSGFSGGKGIWNDASDSDRWMDQNEDMGFRLFFSSDTPRAIDIDYLALIPRHRNDDTPDDVFMPLNVAQDALMQVSTRATVRRMP